VKTAIFLAAVAFAVYWFGFRPACGTRGAVACPAPALEEGVGETLNAAEVCRRSGYLCVGRDGAFQVQRWQLDQGRLRVRVRLPDFLDKDAARLVRDATIEGIMAWDRHPFPIVIDSGEFTVRMWDVGVIWAQGGYADRAGGVNAGGRESGKRFEYQVNGLAVAVPPIGSGTQASLDPLALMATHPSERAMGPALLTRIKAVAMHEMGHALGLMHSDVEGDIMFPQYKPGVTAAALSQRDILTVEALYGLPNGAMVK